MLSSIISLSLFLTFSLFLSLTHTQSHSDFHADLFPDTAGPYSSLSAEDWAEGKNEPVSVPPIMPLTLLTLSAGGQSQLRSCQEERL